MDQPCSYEELRDCYRSIAEVNRLTWAYHPTIHWLNHVYHVLPRQTRPIHIVDIGCGYGDMLRRIHDWAEEKKSARPSHRDRHQSGCDSGGTRGHCARNGDVSGRQCVRLRAGGRHRPRHQLVADAPSSESRYREFSGLDGVECADGVVYQRSAPSADAVSRISLRLPLHKLASVRQTRRPGLHSARLSPRGLASIVPGGGHIPEDEYIIREYKPSRLCVARLRLK